MESSPITNRRNDPVPATGNPLRDPTEDPSGRSSGFSQKHVKHLRLRRKPYGCKTKESLLYPGYCCGAADAAFRPPAADAAARGHPTPPEALQRAADG